MDAMTSKDNVGVGWHPIIEKLDAALKLLDPGYTVTQIKEKFGGLRYYIGFSEEIREHEHFEVISWAMHALTGQAEAESLQTCEECGKPARTTSIGYWARTLCNTHTAQAWAKWTERTAEMAAAEVKEPDA